MVELLKSKYSNLIYKLDNSDKLNQVSQIIEMYQHCLQFRHGSRVTESAIQNVKTILSKSLTLNQHHGILQKSLSLFTFTFKLEGTWNILNSSSLLDTLFSINQIELMADFFSSLLESDNFPVLFERICK